MPLKLSEIVGNPDITEENAEEVLAWILERLGAYEKLLREDARESFPRGAKADLEPGG